MGIGYCVIVKPAYAESVAEQLTKIGETVYRNGEVEAKGSGQVALGLTAVFSSSRSFDLAG